jgi:hypothetical protein
VADDCFCFCFCFCGRTVRRAQHALMASSTPKNKTTVTGTAEGTIATTPTPTATTTAATATTTTAAGTITATITAGTSAVGAEGPMLTSSCKVGRRDGVNHEL